ncbi:MAG: hypothetical protein WDW19_05690 [Neisseriaceae bacterium]
MDDKLAQEDEKVSEKRLRELHKGTEDKDRELLLMTETGSNKIDKTL